MSLKENNIKDYLLEEANRCLKCKNARCQNACPIRTNIPTVISLFQEERYDEAGELLFENNPISIACSKICPFENQCMGNCIRGIKGEPIDFPKIESFLMDNYLHSKAKETHKPELEPKNSKKVAIIGAGPAGLSGGFYLAKKGYDVTIFDGKEKIGGMLTYGIPEFRLTKDVITLLEKEVERRGINFIGNRYFTEEDILALKDDFDSILIATGAWLPKTLNIEGIDKSHSIYAIDYLKNNMDIGSNKKVVVIGAGNVAMDAARTAKKQGNDVVIAYRRKIEDSPATKLEIREALGDGVEILEFVSPKFIDDKGIVLERTMYDENNKLVTIENSDFLYSCNNVIIAVSQKSEFDLNILDNKGINKDNGYFFAGDLVLGPQTVVAATVSGKDAARNINNYLDERSAYDRL